MVEHGFSGKFSFRDMKRFLTFMWMFSVTLLPGGQFNLLFNYRNKRRTKAYHESRLNERMFAFLSVLLYYETCKQCVL